MMNGELAAAGLGSLGVDPAFLFPLVWAWRSPALAMCASLTAYVLVRIHKYKKINVSILFDLGQMSLSFLVAGLLWQGLGWPGP